MKTNNDGARRTAKREAFKFEPADEKIIEEVKSEEDARLNGKDAQPDPHAGGFYTTNSVRRMDTQTVHRMMNTTGSLGVTEGKRKPMTRARMMTMILPLAFIMLYIASVVTADVIGLLGIYIRLTPLSVVLYMIYLLITLLGVLFLMFMDMLPKPLALLVIFVSIFCVHGNMLLIVPLAISFIAIAITVRGVLFRVCVYSLSVIMLLCTVFIFRAGMKTSYENKVSSDDGRYTLVMKTADDGKDLKYTLILESSGTFYRRWEVTDGYVDTYYFTDAGEIAYGRSNEYGQAQTVKAVKISDITGK